MDDLGTARDTSYFHVHGEVNTRKTAELAYERAALLGISKAVVASKTGLSALEVLELICKPRRARHARPVDQKDWVEDLDKYRRFTI